MDNDKATTTHIDAIESTDTSANNVPIRHTHNANEEIIEHLQTTGEEVGMTWRTIMAAVVSFGNIRSSPRLLMQT
jgi:hypothetical protein